MLTIDTVLYYLYWVVNRLVVGVGIKKLRTVHIGCDDKVGVE